MGMPSWLENIVFYEIYTDFSGYRWGRKNIHANRIISRTCGCEIWLNPSPFYDAGYDVADYKKVAPALRNKRISDRSGK